MNDYDAQLQQLQAQMARAKQLKSMVSELRRQRDALAARVRELEAVRLEEQADVDRLEGRSLAAFFYNVIGRRDRQLDKERREAYAARVQYDAAARELAGAEDDLRRCEAELSALEGCEARYAAAFREKTAAVKAAGGAEGEELLRLEARSAFLESQEKELREAISAGGDALNTARKILSSLQSAGSWGTWDLLGGGAITDLVKHSRLDEAQSEVERLQSQLRRFRTELADVTIQADLQVRVEGFLRFADYFFDGLFADWAVLDHIERSQAQVQSTQSQIEDVLSRLRPMLWELRQEQEQLQTRIDALVRRAQV